MSYKKIEKIEIKFGWREEMLSLILLLQDGNAEGKKFARQTLMELADKLDKHLEQQKSLE
jgi:hypothetical protein